MAKLAIFVALALSMLAAAQAQSVYRLVVLTKWDTQDATKLAALSKTEQATVTPCTATIARGIMGVTANVTGKDKASFVKIYDFKTLDDYAAYKKCNKDIPNTDADTVAKARIGFKVPATSTLPAVGTYAYASIANSTKPVDAVKLRNTILTNIKCTLTKYGAYVGDATALAALSYPTNTGYYAGFPEGAGLVGFWAYQTGNPAVNIGEPKLFDQIHQYYVESSLNAGFLAIKIK